LGSHARPLSNYDLYLLAGVLYIVGVWLHIPYGGGHIYSDIPTVFQTRECSGTCLTIPYVNGFIEYPVIVSGFIYLMGVLGGSFPGSVVENYYTLSVAILAIPTFLLIRETLEIAKILGTDQNRVVWYLVATPTFVFMLLVNWYVIGVYFAVFGIRKFLQGRYGWSGFLMGLSAASNLVTAVPALGMVLVIKNRWDLIGFVCSAVLCYGAINAPFIQVNPSLWISFWQYQTNWYIEGSWMLAFLPGLSPLRHYIFPILFVLLYAAIVWLSCRAQVSGVITLSWMTTFAFLFSTYVFTPQMQLILLPFFAIVPIVKRYWEFLAFDIINSLFLILAFSEILLPFGVTYSSNVSGYLDPLRWLSIIRSLWLGKMLIFDGMLPLMPPRVRGWAVSLRLVGGKSSTAETRPLLAVEPHPSESE